MTLQDVGMTFAVRARRRFVVLYGARVAVIAVVAAQFIDLPVAVVGLVPVTLQKIVLFFALPISAGLMGRLVLSKRLLVMIGVMLVVFLAGPLLAGRADSEVLSAVAILLAQGIGALILLSAIRLDPAGASTLMRAWVVIAVFSGALTVAQALGVIPLLTVPGSALAEREVGIANLIRATGLKYDPNFEALMLCLGFAFAQRLRRLRLPASAVILAGIVATFSRTGIVVVALTLVLAPLVSSPTDRRAIRGFLGRLAVVVAIGAMITSFSYRQDAVSRYIRQRVQTAVAVVESPPSQIQGPTRDSAQARYLLAIEALHIFKQHPLTGLGAHRLPKYMESRLGIRRAAHDTYLSLLATGGIAGILAVILLWATAWSGLARIRRGVRRGNLDYREAGALALGLLAFFTFAWFVTLIYSFVFWVGLTLAVHAIRGCPEFQRIQHSRMPSGGSCRQQTLNEQST